MMYEHATVLMITGLVSLVVIFTLRLKNAPDSHGSARWLEPYEATASGLFSSGGVIVGDFFGLLAVHYKDDGHLLTVAPTGKGKGTTAILPNLLRYPFIFLCDPGGENTAIAISAWRQKGYRVQVLNPWKENRNEPWSLPSDSFNPVDIVLPGTPSFGSDAALLAEMILPPVAGEGGSAEYFNTEARSLIRALIMHVVTTEGPKARNLVTVRRHITSDDKGWSVLLRAMAANVAGGEAVMGEATAMMSRMEKSPAEFSGVVSTAKKATNFLTDPVLIKALNESSTDFSLLKGVDRTGKGLAGAVISVVVPLKYLETYAVYTRLALAVALREMQSAPLAREKVLFCLDEFPALGRVNMIASGLATLRKYRVWLWPIIQDVNQLKQLYGQQWQSFISNATLKQWLAASDMETARYISELCGQSTIEVQNLIQNGVRSRSLMPRPLIRTEEINMLDDRFQIVMIGNLPPMLLNKTPYWHRPSLQGLYNQNPFYSGQTPGLPLLTPFLLLGGLFVRFTGWLSWPAPSLVYGTLLLTALVLNPGIFMRAETVVPSQRVACHYQTIMGMRRVEWQRSGVHPGVCRALYLEPGRRK